MSEPLVNELRGITQRVAQQMHFDATVKRVSTKFCSLKAKIRSQKKHLENSDFENSKSEKFSDFEFSKTSRKSRHVLCSEYMYSEV